MKRKIVLFFLLVVLIFNSVNVNAEVISDGIGDINLAAERYYYTNVAYNDIIITRSALDKYEIFHINPNQKSLTATMYLTEWGVWNLGEWNLTTETGTKTIVGGATDWEYVLRVENPITQNLEFTGGNHGSEKFVSMGMYDAVTGEVFNLEVGESKYANRLVIEEKTALLLGELEYMPYANVTRKYTFLGDRINLDSTIEFIRDTRLALSYSAMACVNKDFGRYCMFDDGFYVETAPKGECSRTYLGNRASMTAKLSGDDSEASLTVGIYNKKDMTDNFSNKDKTFIWDMSEGYNKLYFSRAKNAGTELIRSGTVWDFGSYWKINLQ